MLYDILFIDDDFDKQSDSITWEGNAQKLFLELIRDNLRVTYTTGELDDLIKLTEKDLSCIKYIFCDLHLVGITESDPYKKINSKLINIFKELWKKINSSEVTIFINSNFIASYGEKWKTGFEKEVERSMSSNSIVIRIEEIEKKNILNTTAKDELLKNNLDVHIKSLIITEAVKIEKIFNEKLGIDEKFVDVITFENKYKKLKGNFLLDASMKTQIPLIQQLRNKVAHTDNALEEIKDEGVRRKFWEIIEGNRSTKKIYFENFSALTQYINSINALIGKIKESEEKPPMTIIHPS